MFSSSAPSSNSLVRRMALAASVVALSAFSLAALAQVPAQNSSSLVQDSSSPALNTDSSQDSSSLGSGSFLTEDLASLSLAPAPTPQYGENGPRRGYPRRAYRDSWSHIAVEAGGGFTAPVGNSQADLTYGWNFRGG